MKRPAEQKLHLFLRSLIYYQSLSSKVNFFAAMLGMSLLKREEPDSNDIMFFVKMIIFLDEHYVSHYESGWTEQIIKKLTTTP